MPWNGVPAGLRAAVERRLGGRVVEAVTQAQGFSPGLAVRVRLADGGRAFVKAVGPEPNAESPGIHRREARIAAALPAGAPAPRLLDSFEHGGWVVLLFEDVDGTAPGVPWNPADLERVLGMLAGLAVTLTPAPLPAPTVGERYGDLFRGWRSLAEAQADGDPLEGLDPWARRRLPELARAEARWEDAAAGDTLLHADLRADNLLLTGDRVVVVDWPWACVGAPWFDLLGMLPSVRMQGGPPAASLFDRHPVARDADPEAVTAVLTALAGFFVWMSRRPAPPGLPTLRAFQAAQGEACLEWLHERTGRV